jgi:predicted nucleotidyltransferase
VRGDAHRRAIEIVATAFGDDAKSLVFVGACVLGLYARPTGAPLRATTDVDCISTVQPWVLQQKRLAELCTQGLLLPDELLQCRYRIRGTDVDVDVLSPDGFNVGGVNPWFRRAAERSRVHTLASGIAIAAVTPTYFLLTKLAAWLDRGPDAQSSKDAEDIITLAVEVPDLVENVGAEGLLDDAAELWRKVLAKHALRPRDLDDLVDWHLDRRDGEHHARVAAAIGRLAGG